MQLRRGLMQLRHSVTASHRAVLYLAKITGKTITRFLNDIDCKHLINSEISFFYTIITHWLSFS